jgi:hypothetical protein
MGAWMGLVGVVAGATLAMVGQHFGRKSEARERMGLLLLEQCSLLVGLSEDYRNRVWEERNGLSSQAVAAWDLGAYRLAQARLRVLCREDALLKAVDGLQRSGIALGRCWRLSRSNGPDLDKAWQEHRVSLDEFIQAASSVVRDMIDGE